MTWLEIIISFFTLTILEVVLGIDNLILLAVLTDRLPKTFRKKAQYYGLTFAWVTRLILLFSALWVMKLTHPLFTLYDRTFSFRDLFLITGGGFLLFKATQEIHHAVLDTKTPPLPRAQPTLFWLVVLQIGIMDIIFSLDSVLTAIGLTSRFWIMASAITFAILMMLFAATSVNQFITKYPTLKMLALSFLILIGVLLLADGFSFHIPRAYVYFAMLFSLSVEGLNLMSRARKRKK